MTGHTRDNQSHDSSDAKRSDMPLAADAADDEQEPQEPAQAEPAQETAAPATPEEQIAALSAEVEAHKDRALRALAELRNFRRRAQEDRQQQLQYATEALLRDLIPVLDHFEMAAEAGEATEETRVICQGYELILQQLKDVLASHGLEEIEAVEGMFFDPEYHEATERIPTEDPCEGTVMKILRKGYRLHDRVLRPVQVAVAVAPEGTRTG